MKENQKGTFLSSHKHTHTHNDREKVNLTIQTDEGDGSE